MGAHAERPGCRPDSRSCRLGREALELHELDRLAVGRRQSIERLRKLQPGVPALRHRLLGEDADENLPADPDAAPAQVPSHDVRRDRKQPGLDGPRGLVGVARTVEREEGLLVEVSQVLRVRDPGAQETHELRADVVQQGPIGLGIPTLCVCHPLRAGSRASLTLSYALFGF